MFTTDSNTIFLGVLYNDIEIDLLLRMYGNNTPIKDDCNIKDLENNFIYNSEV